MDDLLAGNDPTTATNALLAGKARCQQRLFSWPSSVMVECGEKASHWVNGAFLCPKHAKGVRAIPGRPWSVCDNQEDKG